MPSSSVYRTRFGSLVRAYQLIGYSTGRDYRYIEVNRRIVDGLDDQPVDDGSLGLPRVGCKPLQCGLRFRRDAGDQIGVLWEFSSWRFQPTLHGYRIESNASYCILGNNGKFVAQLSTR